MTSGAASRNPAADQRPERLDQKVRRLLALEVLPPVIKFPSRIAKPRHRPA